MDDQISIKYQEIISQIAGNKKLWLLQAREEMYAMFEDNSGQEYLAVWPDEGSARKFIEGEWDDYQAITIKLNEFLSWLEELDKDEIKIAIYPETGNHIIPMPALEIKKHIEQESV